MPLAAKHLTGRWKNRTVPKTYEMFAKRFKLPKHIGVRVPPHWKVIGARTTLDEMPYPSSVRTGENLHDAAIDAFNRMGVR